MTIVKANTKRGQALIASAQNWEGDFLNQVYDKWSPAKQSAYDYCRDLYYAEKGTCWGICSHNTFGFTVSWFLPNGDIRFMTSKNSYLIIF